MSLRNALSSSFAEDSASDYMALDPPRVFSLDD